MRKFAKFVISEIAVVAGTGLMEWLAGEDFPGWIWGVAFAACVGISIVMYWQEGKLEFNSRFRWRPNRAFRYHRRAFRRDQGRGDLASRIIEAAPDFGTAERVFNACRHDANPRRLDLLWPAMAARLRSEGRTPETWRFVSGEKDRFMRHDMSDRMAGEAAEEEREKQYLWMVMESEETWEKG